MKEGFVYIQIFLCTEERKFDIINIQGGRNMIEKLPELYIEKINGVLTLAKLNGWELAQQVFNRVDIKAYSYRLIKLGCTVTINVDFINEKFYHCFVMKNRIINGQVLEEETIYNEKEFDSLIEKAVKWI